MTIKIAISQFNSRVGDINYNSKKILEDCKRAAEQNVSVLLTPELSLTGYPLEDLITRSDFLSKSDDALADLKYEVSLISNNLALVIGHPFK